MCQWSSFERLVYVGSVCLFVEVATCNGKVGLKPSGRTRGESLALEWKGRVGSTAILTVLGLNVGPCTVEEEDQNPK